MSNPRPSLPPVLNPARAATLPATPAALGRPPARRAPTLLGVAPCAQAPRVTESRTGYRTVSHRAAARTREALRVDRLR